MKALALKLVGILLIFSTIALALSRAPDLPVEALVPRWAPAPSDFVDVKGQLVHLRDVGPREDPLPLVLLHGTSASLHTWEGWVPALQPRRRVITLDLPGFGLTGPFTGAYANVGYSPDAQAKFVLDLLDQLGVQRFVAGGNSLGGGVAWRIATQAPARVERLILVDAEGLAFMPEELPLGWMLARVPVFNRLLKHLLPRELVAQGLATSYGDPQRITPELVDRYLELTLRAGNRAALLEWLQTVELGKDAARVQTLTLPTLILWGGRDRVIPLAAGQEFQRRIAGSRLVVFDELGHVPQEEDAARSVQPVLEFLGLAP